MPDILWLDDPACTDPAVVGGKAANLARLIGRSSSRPAAPECAVPPGFCLTAATHARHAAVGPAALADTLAVAYAELAARCGAADPPVAVRSSAVDEDGADASFAGMFLSLLNVRGADAVLAAVARCWAAAADPRVLAYRAEHGLTAGGLAVLVQSLVDADTAAVVFSVNPTRGAADELVINANWGLGESVVGGLATPDTWILHRPALTLSRFQLGDKERMTVRTSAGTHEVAVPRTMRARPCLSDAQVRELAQLAVHLESIMGWPVDIECAYSEAGLRLLQCRPITKRRG